MSYQAYCTYQSPTGRESALRLSSCYTEDLKVWTDDDCLATFIAIKGVPSNKKVLDVVSKQLLLDGLQDFGGLVRVRFCPSFADSKAHGLDRRIFVKASLNGNEAVAHGRGKATKTTYAVVVRALQLLGGIRPGDRANELMVGLCRSRRAGQTGQRVLHKYLSFIGKEIGDTVEPQFSLYPHGVDSIREHEIFKVYGGEESDDQASAAAILYDQTSECQPRVESLPHSISIRHRLEPKGSYLETDSIVTRTDDVQPLPDWLLPGQLFSCETIACMWEEMEKLGRGPEVSGGDTQQVSTLYGFSSSQATAPNMMSTL